jgi:hypothetical protein
MFGIFLARVKKINSEQRHGKFGLLAEPRSRLITRNKIEFKLFNLRFLTPDAWTSVESCAARVKEAVT